MNNNLIAEISTTKRYAVLGVKNRNLLKNLALATCVAFMSAIFIAQPISASASDPLDTNSSAGQVMTKMKDRLHLTEEQETKIFPIIEKSVQTRREILGRDPQDRNTIKTELQELQWKTDMRLGVILTKEQMNEYEKLKEELSEKIQSGAMQSRKGNHNGRGRGGF